LHVLNRLSWRLLGCDAAFAGWLLAAQLWLGLLWFFQQGFGVARGVILCGLLIGLVALRLFPRRRSVEAPVGATSLTFALRVLLAMVLVLDASLMIVSTTTSFRSGKIPMDEGQTSWRGAQLLWQGENPYGAGALVDLGAYGSRVPQRVAAGVASSLNGPSLTQALARYRATLDANLRARLLPVSPEPTQSAAQELRVYGYKYGPVILLLTALVTPFGAPGAVMLLNGLACFALFAVNWRILRRIAGPQIALAGAAVMALLLDRHITRNYIDRSATDVWALLFGSLAVLACMSRRPLAAAAAVALAVGCKSMPGLMFLPLLFRFRSPAPVLTFAGLSALLFLPWLLRDPLGLVDNVFLWPFFMAPDSTSWEYFAPAWATLVARVVALCALAALWLRHLSGSEPRLFWTLAMSGPVVLLASGVLRNGYIPWASLWTVAAIVEAFAGGLRAEAASRPQ